MGKSLNPQRLRARRKAHPRGMSLVEVLVAIVVLSLGVLGAVGMQAASMQATKEVRHQAIAGVMARELAEKMRGNHEVAIQPTSAANPYLLDITLNANTAINAPALNCYTQSCPLGTNIAAWDIYEWQLRMREALPSPRVLICMDETPFVGGVPQWDCTDTGDVAVLKVSWNRVNTKGELDLTSAAATTPLLVLPLTAGSSE